MLGLAITPRRPRRVVVLAGVALAVALGGTPAAQADTEYKFLQFNMCGTSENPYCNAHGSNSSVDDVVRYILDQTPRPTAVSLNEVCRSQFDAIRSQLSAQGFGMWPAFATTIEEHPSCGGDKDWGIALLSRRSMTASSEWALPYPDSDFGVHTRKLLCVPIALIRSTRLCTTHISPIEGDAYTDPGCTTVVVECEYSPSQDAQIKRVKEVVNSYVTAGPVVLMGDFNVRPQANALDRIYDDNIHDGYAFGYFQEADETELGTRCRCGEETFTGTSSPWKIDYVFVSSAHWHSMWADTVASGVSDHERVYGKATLAD